MLPGCGAYPAPPRRRGGDQGDDLGKGGDGFLDALVEEALPQKFFFQLFKCHMEVPRPLGGQTDAVQLVLAVPGEDCDPARGNDLHAVLGSEAQGCGVPRNITHRRAPSPSFRVK